MKLDLGTVVILIAVAIFYTRLILLHQVRNRRAKALAAQHAMRKGGRKKKGGGPPVDAQAMLFNITNWYLVAAGVVVIGAGSLLNPTVLSHPLNTPYWWVVVTLGILVFALGFN